jgi:hypothetical protein
MTLAPTRGHVAPALGATQGWFNCGLIWTYAYNHEEAIVCFRNALTEDPTCAMAHWGIGYCIGPNYNKPWEAFEEDEKPNCINLAQTSIRAALQILAGLTQVEQALIQAPSRPLPRHSQRRGLQALERCFRGCHAQGACRLRR